MAGPTTKVSVGPVPYVTGSGMGHHFIQGVEANASTYKNGACVLDNGSGLLVESTSPLAAAARTCGVTLADASGKTPGVPIGIAMVLPGQLWEITLSTVSSSHTLAQADQWIIFQVAKDTVSGHWYLDSTTAQTTNVGFLVTAFRDPVGTVDARVIGRFLEGIIGTNNSEGALAVGNLL